MSDVQQEERQEYTYPDDTSAGLLSWEEASEKGFCPMCGYFVLGGSEDHTLHRFGVCSECLDDLKAELGEYGDE